MGEDPQNRDYTAIEASPEDVCSINAIVNALYGSISFKPGEQPNWNRLRSLFLPKGRLIPTDRDAGADRLSLTVDGFIERSKPMLSSGELTRRGFVERELHRKVEAFGQVVHVWSTYESLYADTNELFVRGINSMQFMYSGGRWWTVTIMWDDEFPGNPIPEGYLPDEPRGY